MGDEKLDAKEVSADVAVIGGGPGGYTAAFRAADLGKKVVLIDSRPTLGGVCLNVGCIPSKALLHTARVITEVSELEGVRFGVPEIDVNAVRDAKSKIVRRLTMGLEELARKRNVVVVQGTARFESPRTLSVTSADGIHTVRFGHAIIAAGSSPTRLPGLPYEDSRLMDSTGALELADVPPRLLVIGGGIIGLEMATVYQALGSRVTIVELADQLIPGVDADIVAPLARKLAARCERILVSTKVVSLESLPEGMKATFRGVGAPEEAVYDRVLLAVGRQPNGQMIGAEGAGVQVDAHGFIQVDESMRTNVPHIYAIGDIVGGPMLAHKASNEGKVAAESIAGHAATFEPGAIPSVAYTDPEVAWMGLTEREAKSAGVSYEKVVFPWVASGRALSVGRGEGMTKLLFDKDTGGLVGAAIVGVGAGELIAETVLALELGASAADICVAVHPHPSLSETIAGAAEIALGTVTDLYLGSKQGIKEQRL